MSALDSGGANTGEAGTGAYTGEPGTGAYTGEAWTDAKGRSQDELLLSV